MQNIAEELEAIGRRLRELIPDGHSVGLCFRDYDPNTPIEVTVHGVKSYVDATEIYRRLGIQKRKKNVRIDPDPHTALDGSLGRIIVDVFCEGVPPTCRVEKVIERIPKQETRDTGEFVEVERIKVTCGVDHEAQSLRTEAAA